MVAQVQPPILDKELVDMFMDTLQDTYFERMVGSTSSEFSDLVKVRECIESSLKSGKIQDASSSQARKNESLSSSQEEDEDDINAVMENVEYSHRAPTRPHGPSSFQRSPFSASRYPIGQPKMPRTPYQHP